MTLGVYVPCCPVPGGGFQSGGIRMTGNTKKQLPMIISHSLAEAQTCPRLVFMPFRVLVSKHKRRHTLVLLVSGFHLESQLTVERRYYLGVS